MIGEHIEQTEQGWCLKDDIHTTLHKEETQLDHIEDGSKAEADQKA